MTAFNLNGEELRDVFDGMKTLGRRYHAEALQGRNIGFSNMHQLMQDLWEGRSKALPCGAGVGMLAVDHEGAINLCHRFTGSEMTYGSVQTGLERDKLSAFIEARADRTDKGCATCRIRNLCAGGCYHESYARYADPLKPTYHYCDLMRDWVDFGIEVYGDLIARGRDSPGRAKIETTMAADDLRARMRAEIFGEGDVARLVEGADEIARLHYGA